MIRLLSRFIVRSLLILSVVLLVPGCANDYFMKYQPSSGQPLHVSISPAVNTPDEIPIAGATAAWTASLAHVGPTAGTQLGREGERFAREQMNPKAAPKREMATELLDAATAAIRANPRFRLDVRNADAEFHFEVASAMFNVAGSFSSEVQPWVVLRGRLVAKDGRVLWKYITTISEIRGQDDEYDVTLIRQDADARKDALKKAVRMMSAHMSAHLSQ